MNKTDRYSIHPAQPGWEVVCASEKYEGERRIDGEYELLCQPILAWRFKECGGGGVTVYPIGVDGVIDTKSQLVRSPDGRTSNWNYFPELRSDEQVLKLIVEFEERERARHAAARSAEETQ